ncbi:MAG: PilZ domain-containing protein [Myxococcales bacterium]|nr:PilZ domain-containing protein [Myxococcales bacterium]
MDDRRTHPRIARQLLVDHILGEHDHCLCVTEDLGPEGLRLAGVPGHGWGAPRYAWLQFRLPDGGPPVRALGELLYEEPGRGSERVRGYRFKYLNPHARRRYTAWLAAAA